MQFWKCGLIGAAASSWPSFQGNKMTNIDRAICRCGGRPCNDRKAKSCETLRKFPFYIYGYCPQRSCPMYGKPARKGALPLLARPLLCFESAQQLKRPRRERQGSLPQLATLSILTRVKLDSSSGRIEGGKVVRLAPSTPGRPLGIHPQDAALGLRAGKPTYLT